jgi:anthranilate phosphoribosyltransferase
MPLFLEYLHRVTCRENLSAQEAEHAMNTLLSGEASTPQITGFLVALKMKGETTDELLGFARAMRSKVTPVAVAANGAPLLDTCGTGGDGLSTFNISTVAAFVVAGTGVRVAKHGNRSFSSQCGSADLLESLGIAIGLTAGQMARAIEEVGIGFLFAPAVHPAMKHAQPARAELKMRTVFNLLGPLTNPAGATAQLIGASSAVAAQLMAETLAQLGVDHAFVVHGSDGLDEITTTGPTLVFEIRKGALERRELNPSHFGVPLATLEQLRGGDRQTNCAIARRILEGEAGPMRDIVLVNAAAALVAAGRANGFRQAMTLAAGSIDSGAARAKAEQLARFSQDVLSASA